MPVVWMHARGQLRRRWRTWVLLAIFTAVAAGGSIAAAAGARRAISAYPRMVSAANAYDLATGGSGGQEPIEETVAMLAKRPEVAESLTTWTPAYELRNEAGRSFFFDQIAQSVEPTGRLGTTINRAKFIRGRRANPNRADEASLSFVVEQPGIGLGSVITPVFRGPQGEVLPKVRIVGIHAAPGDLRSVNSLSFPGVAYTPAFHRQYHELYPPADDSLGLLIRLKRSADLDRFVAAVRATGLDVPTTTRDHLAGVQRSLRFEAIALWILAALLGLVAAAAFGQTIARQTVLESGEDATWRALGTSRKQIAASAAIRSSLVGIGAAAAAAAVAIAISPLTPIGITRRVEPNPGVAVDAAALGIGGAAVLALFTLTMVLTSVRISRGGGAARPVVPSKVARAVTVAGAPPSVTGGVRLALEPGRGGTAVPVRAAMAGAALGIAALVAALMFAASLGHLINTPRLSGYTWDALADVQDAETFVPALRANADIEAFTEGGVWDIRVQGRRLLVMLTQNDSGIDPTIIEGRIPRGTDEIALGPATMRALRVGIGGVVTVEQNVDPAEDESHQPAQLVAMRVVGSTIVPGFFFEAHDPGTGAAITVDALRRLTPNLGGVAYLIRFRGQPPPQRVEAFFREHETTFFPRQRPAGLLTLAGVADLAGLVAALIAAAGATALVHALATSVRRRRRDLAVLKTLGFVRRQILGAVATQSGTMTAIALAFGIPAGIAAGRWGWILFAEHLGVLPEYQVPALAVALVVPGALLAAVLVAALPGRAAARTQPAIVLRTE